jgi:hypothetical protein
MSRQSSLKCKGNYYGLLKTSLRRLVDFGCPARLGLCCLPTAADHSVRDGWRMNTDAKAEHLSEVSEKMKRAIFEIGNGEAVSDVIFSATMALACFIYDVTDHGNENSVAKRSADLLTDAIQHLVKEDMN